MGQVHLENSQNAFATARTNVRDILSNSGSSVVGAGGALGRPKKVPWVFPSPFYHFALHSPAPPPPPIVWEGVGVLGGGGTRCHIQHSPNTPTTGLRECGNDTSKSTSRSGRQKAATRRNMRREGRVTV